MICFPLYEFEVESSSGLLNCRRDTLDQIVSEIEGVIVGDIDKNQKNSE